MFSAGIYGSHLIAGAAEVFGIDFTPHTWSNGLGLAANLHCAVASSASIVEFPFDPPGLVPETRDGILSGPLVVDSAGYLQAPTGPGLGVELDREAVERHTLATFSSGSD
jgi:L-alanine-DL-glutamate epimerase-like enolase superfamily enzyme